METIGYDSHAGAPDDSLSPTGEGSDLAGSLDDVARRYEGEHLAAMVAFGDGMETERTLARPELPDVPVWTVGVGDTTAPDDVRIEDAEYSQVVRVPSRAVIRAGIGVSGPTAKRVHIQLMIPSTLGGSIATSA